jgi:hypothetical protein
MTENGDIMLSAGDEVEVLFKVITTREVPYLQDQGDQPLSVYIRPRNVSLLVLHSNRQPYSHLELILVPSSPPIDHTFRFYEPQNSHVTLVIPPFLSLNHAGLHAVLSAPNAVVDIIKQTGEMRVQTKTADENTVSEMTLYMYADQYRETLLATCRIELHAMITIYTKLKAGL